MPGADDYSSFPPVQIFYLCLSLTFTLNLIRSRRINTAGNIRAEFPDILSTGCKARRSHRSLSQSKISVPQIA
ncbi:hypothetical protein RRG08_057204 [Elysia crispata]|uniref:Uncharacterized protein n=1 Tax=Elysia crispata TaxID=231223 RepID=A0AAE0XXH5_9GAST|nr:hypothetical protein RRG08_057204 [Elysia crispata]